MGDLGADIQPMEESGCGTTSTDSLKRLIITEVVLENFKSYAGEQRVGPFHKVGLLLPNQENKMSACAPCASSIWAESEAPPEDKSSRKLSQSGADQRWARTAVLLIGGGAQWEWQVQRHRCYALRLWQEGQAGERLHAPPHWISRTLLHRGPVLCFSAMADLHCGALRSCA